MAEWYVFALAAMLFFGLANVALKDLLAHSKPFFESLPVLLPAALVLLAAAFVILYAYAPHVNLTGQVATKGALFLVLAGFAFACFLLALQTGKVAPVTAIASASTAVVAIAGLLFLGETMTFQEWAGVLLIVVGGALLVG